MSADSRREETGRSPDISSGDRNRRKTSSDPGGAGDFGGESAPFALFERKSFEEELKERGRIVFTNKGRSMMPMLREDRDLMVIEKRPLSRDGKPLRCRRYDVVLYRRNGRYILHRILKVLPDGYVICGDHNWKREYDIGDRQIIGILSAFVRDGREISVTDRKYRLYVHLWCDFFCLRAFLLRLRAFLGRARRGAGRRLSKKGSRERQSHEKSHER